MFIRRLIVLTLLRVPPIRRYAQAKWRLAEMLQEAEAVRDALSVELANQRAATGMITAERDALRDEAHNLEAISRYLGTARDAALDDVEQHRSATAALSVERDDLLRQTSAVSAERDDLLRQIEQISSRLSGASAERDDLLRQIEQTSSRLSGASAERDDLLRRIEQVSSNSIAVSAERDSAMKQVGLLQASVKELAAERDEAAKRIGESGTTIHSLTDQLEELQRRLAGLVAERETFLVEIKQLKKTAANLSAPLPQTVEVDISPTVSSSAEVISFDQLLDRENRERTTIFHIHVPKTAGTTVSQLFRQNGFWQLTLDDVTNDFFSVVDERRWFARAVRDSHLFSGHYRLDHSIFRRIPGPHTIVTTLRHPIKRMLSYYNFSGRHPIMAYHADIAAGRMSVVDYAEFILSASGPQYSYFDDTGAGAYVRSGSASAKECLENLFAKVTFFGLTERFWEFSVIAGNLFALDNVLSVNHGKVTSEMKNPAGTPLKTALTAGETRKLAVLLEDDLWFYEMAERKYKERIASPRIKAVLTATTPLKTAYARVRDQARAALRRTPPTLKSNRSGVADD
jgi:hypothetical protein